MGIEENKAVVRRFGDELTTGRNTDPDLIDELLAPNYVNLAMGDADISAFKAMIPAMTSIMKDVRIDDLELVAEGDSVFARFNYSFTLPDGSRTTARTMAYYRLADGKIVVNDVMSVPDMLQVLGPLMAPPPGAQP
jgi:ketosteroid isomerase-like protein